jgi:hypothetical protein
MNRLSSLLSLLSIILAVVPELAAAASIQVPNYGGTSNIETAAQGAGQSIANVIMAVTGIIGVLAVSYGGIKMLTGKPDEGKQIIGYSLIGVFVVEAAAGIVSLVV